VLHSHHDFDRFFRHCRCKVDAFIASSKSKKWVMSGLIFSVPDQSS